MTAADDYLARLDESLRDVPHRVAADIRAGVAEELRSLDPDAAEARIAQLGDPAVIAREALDAGGYAPPAAPAAARPERAASPGSVPVSRSRGFAIAAALTLSFGVYLVPFVGWFVGVALVLLSTMWRTWEKAVAIVAPLLMLVLTLVGSIPAWIWVDDVLEPTFGVHTFIVLTVGVVIPASGLWLLWRMRGRAQQLPLVRTVSHGVREEES